jgi:hypothetical protein
MCYLTIQNNLICAAIELTQYCCDTKVVVASSIPVPIRHQPVPIRCRVGGYKVPDRAHKVPVERSGICAILFCLVSIAMRMRRLY